MCNYATKLAEQFQTRDLRRSVYDTLEELLTSDHRLTAEESQLLAVLKKLFQL
jgi:hypothetical protein